MTMTELTFWMRRAVPQILSSSQVKKKTVFSGFSKKFWSQQRELRRSSLYVIFVKGWLVYVEYTIILGVHRVILYPHGHTWTNTITPRSSPTPSISFSPKHCHTYTVPKIRFTYSQKWNGAASVPIPTVMYLWAIYIFQGSNRQTNLGNK